MLPEKLICDRYQLTKQLSKKAGRSTYLAKDYKHDKQVVIKILEFNELFSWDDLKLFEREAQTLKNISHSNIPDYLDYFEIDTPKSQGFALVQSYITAPSLEELICQGIKFTEVEIIDLATKLLKILNYLHQLNPPIIHRDIKPSNILLNNRSGNSIGDVYIVDFGSVQTLARKEAGTITIVGSYGYIPLEQFMGKTTFASDLYSLGMTLIYLVSGIHPADLTQGTGKVKFDSSQISFGFAIWLSKITEPYVDQRYLSAKIALATLNSKKNTYQINEALLSSSQTKEPMLNFSSDYQTLEITYELERLPVGCLLGLIIFVLTLFSGVHALGLILSFAIAIFLSVFSNEMFSPRSKYRLLLLNRHGQIKEGFYWQDRKDLTWLQSLPLKIDRVIYSPSYTFKKCLDPHKKIVPGGEVNVRGKLSLITKDKEFHISEFKTKEISITDANLWWIGNQVSSFLDLELEVISQTPIIPHQVNG